MTLGKTVKRLRKERRWTQDNLAEKSNLGRSYISLLELDRIQNPGVTSIVLLAKAFDIHEDVLCEAAGLKRLTAQDAEPEGEELAGLRAWLEANTYLEQEEKDQIWAIAQRQAPEEAQLSVDRENTKGDFVDHMIDEWTRVDPGHPRRSTGLAFPISARIERAAHFLHAATVRLASSYGLTFGEYSVLFALRRAGPPPCRTPTTLLSELLITPSAITKQVDHLVALGLVERRPAPHDQRSVLICLTAQGTELIDRLRADLSKTDRVLVTQLPQEEREMLARLLRKLLLLLEH